jgi:hypothetical protein
MIPRMTPAQRQKYGKQGWTEFFTRRPALHDAIFIHQKITSQTPFRFEMSAAIKS